MFALSFWGFIVTGLAQFLVDRYLVSLCESLSMHADFNQPGEAVRETRETLSVFVNQEAKGSISFVCC